MTIDPKSASFDVNAVHTFFKKQLIQQLNDITEDYKSVPPVGRQYLMSRALAVISEFRRLMYPVSVMRPARLDWSFNHETCEFSVDIYDAPYVLVINTVDGVTHTLEFEDEESAVLQGEAAMFVGARFFYVHRPTVNPYINMPVYICSKMDDKPPDGD